MGIALNLFDLQQALSKHWISRLITTRELLFCGFIRKKAVVVLLYFLPEHERNTYRTSVHNLACNMLKLDTNRRGAFGAVYLVVLLWRPSG